MKVTANQHQHCSNCGGDMGFPLKWGLFQQRSELECFSCGKRDPVQKPVYVVVLSGSCMDSINGEPVTAQKTMLVGAFSKREEADVYLSSSPEIGPKWKVAAMWIEEVAPGKAPNPD